MVFHIDEFELMNSKQQCIPTGSNGAAVASGEIVVEMRLIGLIRINP
jgi:hypothetical protein